MDRHLFVYGSLCAPAVFAAVTGLRRRMVPARLAGHRALRVRGQAYPMLVRAGRNPDTDGRAVAAGVVHAEAVAETSVVGGLYRHLPGFALRRLDAFEGPWYRRVRVNVALIGPDSPGAGSLGDGSPGAGSHGSSSRASCTRVLAFTYRRARSARIRLVDEPWLLQPFLRTQARGFARYWRHRLRRAPRQRIR